MLRKFFLMKEKCCIVESAIGESKGGEAADDDDDTHHTHTHRERERRKASIRQADLWELFVHESVLQNFADLRKR
jgi:hypothetical protein